MKGIYDIGAKYTNKDKAIERAITERRFSGGSQELFTVIGDGRQFRTAMLMPGMTCHDIRWLVRYGHITSETKLVLVDDVDGRNRLLEGKDASKYGGAYTASEWRERVMDTLRDELSDCGRPMIPLGNLVFVNGDILATSPGRLLRQVGEEKLDFIFLDFCSACLPAELGTFVNNSRDCLADGTVVWITSAVGAAVPQFCRTDAQVNQVYENRVTGFLEYMTDVEDNIHRDVCPGKPIVVDRNGSLWKSIEYTNFSVARLFNNQEFCPSCGIFLYKGDRRAPGARGPESNMAIFTFRLSEGCWSDRIGRYFEDFMPHSDYRPVVGDEVVRRVFPRLEQKYKKINNDGRIGFLMIDRKNPLLIGMADIKLMLGYIDENAESIGRRFRKQVFYDNLFDSRLWRSGKVAGKGGKHFMNDTSRAVERFSVCFEDSDQEIFPYMFRQSVRDGKRYNGFLRSTTISYEANRLLYDKVIVAELAKELGVDDDGYSYAQFEVWGGVVVWMRFADDQRIDFWCDRDKEWLAYLGTKNSERLWEMFEEGDRRSSEAILIGRGRAAFEAYLDRHAAETAGK